MSTSKAMPLLEEALNYRAMRQDLIASNIANVDTPGFIPRDISFESVLAEKKAKIFNEDNKKLKMSATSSKHILETKPSVAEGKLFFRDGHMARNDGNSVDLDVETTELAKNSQMYNAVIAAMMKGGKAYTSVIESSSKI